MTAQEKFEARLKELGLYGEYGPDDHVGCFLEDGSIVVLVHIQSDPTDGYTEFRYPPFEEMWKDSRFREKCKDNFYDSDDDHFVAELAYWLDIHKNGAKCPLAPVDAYWAGAPETEWFNYEDDKMKKYEVTLYFTTSVEVVVEADNEDKARMLAYLEAGDDKYNDEILGNLQAADSSDVVEVE